jgi:hypothetical protein
MYKKVYLEIVKETPKLAKVAKNDILLTGLGSISVL